MESEHTQLLVKTIASHFPEARVEGATVRPGFGELAIECEVNSVRDRRREVSVAVLPTERWAARRRARLCLDEPSC